MVLSGQYRVDVAGGAGGRISRPWTTLLDIVGLDPGPTAVAASADTLDVLAPAPHPGLRHLTWGRNGGWSGDPAAFPLSAGGSQVLVRGADDALYRGVVDGGQLVRMAGHGRAAVILTGGGTFGRDGQERRLRAGHRRQALPEVERGRLVDLAAAALRHVTV